MKKTKTTTIQQETIVPTTDDTQPVVAFRVGQLEKRFDSFEAKLDNLGGNFVTIETLREMKLNADNEHKIFRTEIDAIMTKTTSYPLIEKIVFTAVGLVLLSVLGALLALVITQVK